MLPHGSISKPSSIIHSPLSMGRFHARAHVRAELLPALLNPLENILFEQLKREGASMRVSTPFSASSPSTRIVPFLFRFNALTHESTRQIGSSVHVCLSYPAIPTYNYLHTPTTLSPAQKRSFDGSHHPSSALVLPPAPKRRPT